MFPSTEKARRRSHLLSQANINTPSRVNGAVPNRLPSGNSNLSASRFTSSANNSSRVSASGSSRKLQSGITREQHNEIEEVFKVFDPDKDMALNVWGLKFAAKALGVEIDTSDAMALIRENDRNGDELIYYDDFQRISKLITKK